MFLLGSLLPLESCSSEPHWLFRPYSSEREHSGWYACWTLHWVLCTVLDLWEESTYEFMDFMNTRSKHNAFSIQNQIRSKVLTTELCELYCDDLRLAVTWSEPENRAWAVWQLKGGLWSQSHAHLPVYSVLEATEEVVEPFSQSFSPLRLLDRVEDRQPSAESGLCH